MNFTLRIKKSAPFLLLLAISFFPACTGGGKRGADTTKTIASQPIPISGTGIFKLTFENARARCNYKNLGELKYQVDCLALVVAHDGSQIVPTGIAEGVSLHWQEPKVLNQGPLKDLSCQTSENSLSQNCTLRLESNLDEVDIKFDLTIKDTDRSRVESDVVQLTYSIKTFGRTIYALNFDRLKKEEPENVVLQRSLLKSNISLMKTVSEEVQDKKSQDFIAKFP